MKILKIFFLSLLFWLQYSLWLGKNGVLDYIRIYKKVAIKRQYNEFLDIRNNQIILEIENFNNRVNHDIKT